MNLDLASTHYSPSRFALRSWARGNVRAKHAYVRAKHADQLMSYRHFRFDQSRSTQEPQPRFTHTDHTHHPQPKQTKALGSLQTLSQVRGNLVIICPTFRAWMQRLLLAFGSAYGGRLGLGAPRSSQAIPRWCETLAKFDLKDISAGGAHSAALTSKNRMHASMNHRY